MCGRFAFFTPGEAVRSLFGVACPPELRPRYNIAPTQPIMALRASAAGDTECAMLRWGLVPSWAKDPAIGNRLINARLETVAEKPAFRAALRRRRCAVLADGFYEWQATGDGPRQPWFIHAADGRPFLMAGLWERWEGGGQPLETCTILTTAASEALRPVHHRMPVILPRAAWPAWLAAPDQVSALAVLAGGEGPAVRLHRVSRAVNSPANDSPALIEAAA